jgi:hypothetical protein
MSLILTGNSSSLTIDSTNGITFPLGSGAQSAPSKVLQVVQATASNQDSTTSNSFVASSLTGSITPLFATSKIYVVASAVCTNTGNGQGNYTLYRNSTNLGGGGAGQASLQMFYSSSGYQFVPITISYLDSPATTNSTTYTVYFKTQSGGSTTYFGTTNITETLVMMEIAA